MPDKSDELGGLWQHESRSGTPYMSGKLTVPDGLKPGDVLEVVVFPNAHKQPGERTPDHRVYRSRPRDDAGDSHAARQPQQTPQQRHAQTAALERAKAQRLGAAAVQAQRPADDFDDTILF